MNVIPAEIERLFALAHPDPHSILGAHPAREGIVVRSYRPDAEGISLIVDGEPARPMSRVDARGLFELVVPDRREVFRYRIEVTYPGERRFTLREPYTFLPTFGDLDLHLWGVERHDRIYEKLGAHVCEVDGLVGTAFAVWAPHARGVSVVGDFNGWDGRLHMMRLLGDFGIWEIFVPDVTSGAYKYELRAADGSVLMKTDPFAAKMATPPGTDSIVYKSSFHFADHAWQKQKSESDPLRRPMSIYEMHLASWRHVPEEDDRPLTYRELAPLLGDYLVDLGFTHVELLPVMEHPFAGSWGYQVSGFFAPTSRFGDPDDFRYLVDYLHRRGIGVILDWVPAHFPKDTFTLGRFDGTALYEHLDPRQGEHPDWGTYIFNYGRKEVRNFLMASAGSWLSLFHADGLRLDAVASMLYLDYSRAAGQWIPNVHGGRENLDAIAFLKELNERMHAQHPGVLMVAEESTAWPGVSRPTYTGGLGFGFKWNMGWMHDTLAYFSKDPVHRRYSHQNLTFGIVYAWSENFILPLSHDEVVHEKRALLSKMPGDPWQAFANLRALYGYMWAHPGKKLLFMGGEFAQLGEWNHDASLDWHLLDRPEHRGVWRLVRDCNRIYREEEPLWEADVDPAGFQWIDAGNAEENVLSFLRIASSTGRKIVCVCNFSPVVRHRYRVGVPAPGRYVEILNTDAEIYGGSNVGNMGAVEAEPIPAHGLGHSVALELPPLAVLWLALAR
jgi:1,4-alpha-glucan branching enzyme